MSNDLKRLVEAIAFSANAHRRQFRKDQPPTPYINHPIALLRILAVEAEVEELDVLISALLHDYLEDCCGENQVWLEEGKAALREKFGEHVLEIVCEVTDEKTLEKGLRKRLQIEHAKSLSREAKLVKLADKIANVRDLRLFPPHDWNGSRCREYLEWATKVVDELRGTHAGLEQLYSNEVELIGPNRWRMPRRAENIDPNHPIFVNHEYRRKLSDQFVAQAHANFARARLEMEAEEAEKLIAASAKPNSDQSGP